jgi:putative transposase
VQQCARQLTDHFDGFLLDKRYLIHDRNSKFTAAFDQYLRDNGVEPVVLPPKAPNLNSHCERFVRSIKEEMLGRMIFMGEASLRYAIRCYLRHYHAERNHQGLGNELITPEPDVGKATGRVKRQAHLGGLLSYYYREAA